MSLKNNNMIAYVITKQFKIQAAPSLIILTARKCEIEGRYKTAFLGLGGSVGSMISWEWFVRLDVEDPF